MTLHRRQFTGWAIIFAAVLLGGTWLARLDYAQKISTDVLDLIPTDEQAPELTLVRSLASQAEARTMLFELTANDAPAPAEAAAQFVAALGREPAFDQAVVMGDTAARDAIGKELFEQRFTLLFPLWLRERREAYAATGGAPADFSTWLAREAAASLQKFLGAPEALGFQELIPSDPLLLMPGAVDRLKDGLSLVQPTEASAKQATVVWARLAASPLSEAGQAPAFAAIARAADAVRASHPGFAVAYTGVNRFAAASRARIEREVTWLNVASLVAVLVVAFTFIRAVHRGLHLLPVVLLSVLGAWVGVTLVFDRVHIMVFVVGSLLTGVAIDYGFYLFMQPPARPDEDYWAKVRRLAKPLLASCLTTVAGFALLLFSELPFIRELGVFVGAGLICALAGAVVYFSTVRDPFLPAREFRGGARLPRGWRRNFRRALIALWIVALPGLALIKWKDDIRELEIPSPELKREDARISALFGDQGERTVYLTYGNSLAEARDALARLETWLRTTGGRKTQAIGLGAVVPTASVHAAAVQFAREHPEFAAQLSTALAAGGFDEKEFAGFFAAYARHAATARDSDLDAAIRSLQSKLTGPIGLLLHTGQPNWFVTLARSAPTASPPPETHTVSASQLQSLNQLFARYRQSALWLSLTGLAIVGLGVLLSYGWRDGVRIFAIPCGACLGLFGLLGWIGHPLNLFHLLGAFLGVCLTHNYSIFSATSAYRHETPPVSVRLSALTAAASFGVLALSGIPVVRALGSTVAMMVVTALVMIEFEHLAPLGEKTMSTALLQAWARTVRRHGDARAVVQAADGTAATFRQLGARAAAWRDTHVSDPAALRGRAVVFAAPNGIGWLEIFLGLLHAGAVVVPLDATEPAVAQRNIAQSLRAGSWWNGHQLEPLARAKRFRDPDICLIKLTSGTTGRPRALVFTATQLLADGRQVTASMGITRRDLNYALIPLGHSYGLGNLTIPLLAQGVPLICGASPLPHAIAEDFARWRPAVFPGVPAMWRALAGSDLALPGLRLGISAGAPLPPEVARDFAARFGQRLHSFYGSSETGGIAYDRTGRAALAGEVGRAMQGVKLRPLRGARLQVASAAVTTHGNRRRIGKLGAWVMPDRVALDARGNVTLLGRRGTTVKIAGRRVNLAEVTDRLRRLPGVREAWAGVSAGDDPVLGAVVAGDRMPAELRGALLADTAAWKIPKRLAVVPALPVTARGKPDVRALRALIETVGRDR